MSKKLQEALTRDPQGLLDKSVEVWAEHDDQYRPQLKSLLDAAHTVARNSQSPEQLPPFPKPLLDYRRWAATAISAILYYSESGELHPEIYAFTHTLGLVKDVYVAGVLANYPDWPQYRESILSADTRVGLEYINSATRAVVLERMKSMFARIETISGLNSPIPLGEMHNIRKQLRGFSMMLNIRQKMSPNPKVAALNDEIAKIVGTMGNLHDVYVTTITLNTANTVEFEQEYANQTIVLPTKFRQRIISTLQK